ncbi:M23 family metallopeptidase [bacterium]|jgi:murein DD-endopeptidase MepM/ murein hydrolase activator NlpD|nr:M23 family metallopeptidase [bacterium]
MRRRQNFGSMIFTVALIAIIGGVVYLYNSAMFERNKPTIEIINSGYWNLTAPLKIKIEDESGLLSYKVTLQSGSQSFDLANEQFASPQGSQVLEIKAPQRAYALNESEVKVTVEAKDASKWNFFAGNTAMLESTFQVDKKRPYVSTISSSYRIIKGGAAVVVFKAEDENMEEFYVETNFGKRFIPQPFYKEGYYVTLLAWPVTEESFHAVIIARDKAGNVTQSAIPVIPYDKSYKLSRINLSDSFLNGKVSELAYAYGVDQNADLIGRFKFVNEDMRKKNEKVIQDITSKVSDTMVSSFPINKMYPLKNGEVVAQFGDHRIYSYQGKEVSEAYHLGLDLASNAMSPIMTQNPAVVAFAQENGIYGNMPVLYHGLGLYTLYGHCSSVLVKEGESLHSNQTIAKSGRSGYAMGDHLHFGVLVQGIEVRPQEWMDEDWIRKSITDPMRDARKLINQQ